MSDVLASGSDREPWRPSRRLVRVVALALVIVAALAYGGREVQQRRAERAAERRAVQQVTLSVQEAKTGGFRWELKNSSGTDLRIRSAFLESPRTLITAVPERLAPHDTVWLEPGRSSCGERLYDVGPSVLIVEAVTPKGSRVNRRVALGEAVGLGMWEQLRAACHVLPAGDALQATLVAAAGAPGVLRLTYQLANVGALPLALDQARYEPGVTIELSPASVTLPVGARLRLIVTLRVTHCGQYQAAVERAIGGDGLDGPGTLSSGRAMRTAQERLISC